MKFFSATIALAFICWCGEAHATVSLQFSQPFTSGIASGFSNGAVTPVPTDGMAWGIIVDTSSNGFKNSGTAYNSIASISTPGFLSVGGTLTDDYFIPSTQVTSDFSASLEGDFTTAGGHGTIDTISAIPLTPTAGAVVSSGESFALVWFATSSGAVGSKYGIFTDPAGAAPFVLPSDGSFAEFGADFTGTDPSRAASNTFTASGVPEPTSSMLALVGFAGLFLRRRRA